MNYLSPLRAPRFRAVLFCGLIAGLASGLATGLAHAAADSAPDASASVFHFDFKDAAGKKDIPDATGKFHALSATADFQVQSGALRLAPGSRITIPDKPGLDLSKAVTVSAWILKSSTPDVTPILMKGLHPDPLQFLFSVGWRYPVFSYKNEPHQNFWKGISYDGYFGSSIKYSDPTWELPNAAMVETGGTWYHVAARFDRGDVAIYVDGALVAHRKAEKEELLADNDEPFTIGIELQRRQDHIEPYAAANMLLNDLRLYNRALSDDELKTLYVTERPKYPAASQIPAGKTHTSALAPSYAYLGPEYDPLFQRKLALTAEYEKHIPANPFAGWPMTATMRGKTALPELIINGKAEYPMAIVPAPLDYATAEFMLDQAANCTRDFAAAGVNVVGVDVLPQRYWLDEGRYDWAKFDEFFSTALAANPQARILVGLPLYPVAWFEKKYPGQLEQYLHGAETKTMRLAGPLGSAKWLEVSQRMIHDVISHIEAASYGSNVFGYLCGGGQSAEWYWPGGLDGLPGYSAATRQSFRAWLRKKYDNSESALRTAWNSPAITFDTAEIPTPEMRRKTEFYAFRDPAIAGQEIDFREYMTASTVHHLATSAHTVKEASGRKKLVFAYQGYAMSATGRPKLANNGLQGLQAALDNPDIDCVVNLIDYSKRRGGQAGLGIAPFYASARLRGKLMWEEHDYRTHVARGAFAAEKTDDEAETISVLQRSFGMTLAQNAGVWWRVFENDWYHQENVMRTIAAMKRAGDAALKDDKSPVAQVALIYDEKMPYYLQGGDNNFLRQQVWGAYEGASRMGAPFDMYLLDDIKNVKMPDYKLYIFLNAYRLDAATRRAIAAKVRKKNAVAVWCFAPGYMDAREDMTGNKFSLDTMRDLTGFSFVEDRTERDLTLQLTDKTSPITKLAAPFATYKAGPSFTVSDPAAKTLGTVATGPALALKEYKNWRSVYSLMPLTQELLQGLCDYAGVHVYSRSFDPLYVNRDYLFFYTSTPGAKTISLPARTDVQEVFGGKTVGKQVAKITETLPAAAARLYRLGK